MVKSKGELFLPKKFRQKLNIEVGDVFNVTVREGKIILEKKIKLLDLLDLPLLTKPLTYKEIKEGIFKEQQIQMDLSENDLGDD